MNKQSITLLVAAVVCISLLAVIGGKTWAGSKQAAVPGREKTSIHKPDRSAEKARINKIISSMSRRAQTAVKIDDTDAFLADLDKVLAFDASGAADDIPLLTLVDKQHYLPDGYAPKHLVPVTKNTDFAANRNGLSLRPEAEAALHTLAQAASRDGVRLLVSSTYRSYEYQKTVYEKWVKIDGQEEADRESARPGSSQHQLGTAVDFGSVSDDFAGTPMGIWMYKNAAEYGWSLSFPQEYEDVTGYRWESWHFRYIGKDACMFQKKYFGGVQQFMIEFIHAWNSLNAG
jgi:zinc D-Ala-D-Ala carboxypeptidase